MKCPNCKYEYEWDWIAGKRVFMKGDVDFPELEIEAHPFIINNENESVFVCRKCGVLFIDVRWLR